MTKSEKDVEPLITCLTVTWGRPGRFRRAVEQYLRQTWKHKEMVVVLGDDDESAREFVRGLQRPDIHVYSSSGTPTIPRLRNLAIDCAKGDILCQWDDDDLYHPLRLERQLRHMISQKADASMFGDHLHYFEGSNELFWADWWKPYGSGLPGTLMCRRSLDIRYREEYVVKSDGVLEQELRKRARVTYLCGEGYLYTYVYHGGNVWDLAHHRKIAEGLACDGEWVRSHLEELGMHLAAFPELPRELSCGSGEKIQIG